jgi:hypothetical protein
VPPRTTDPRYGSNRWRKIAKRVLARDGYVCRIVPGCRFPAKMADHIIEVYPGMPDSLFFGMGNLRAGCAYHNTARGIAARLKRESEPEAPAPSDVVTEDYT